MSIHARDESRTQDRFVDEAVIEVLACSEAELRERVLSLEADVESYRLVAQEALHALHRLTVTHTRLRDRHAELLAARRERRPEAA